MRIHYTCCKYISLDDVLKNSLFLSVQNVIMFRIQNVLVTFLYYRIIKKQVHKQYKFANKGQERIRTFF